MFSAGPPASYVPHHFESGTFPVPRNYNLRQMLFNYSRRGAGGRSGRIVSTSKDDLSSGGSDQVIPSFPFSDVPIYADTVDIETLAFHEFWGCALTPDNVAARIGTDDIRFHAWVAAKRVIESGLIDLANKDVLIEATMDQFMVELGLVLLDLCPGPLIVFVDPRLQDDSARMVAKARAMVAKFAEVQVRRWRVIVTLPATEDGMDAARELREQYGIQTNLSLVSCLPHAAACIEAGAGMVSMSVGPIMEWFEQRCGNRSTGHVHVSREHPGIEAVQSCATYIRRHGLNTTLLMTDVRQWDELKQLGGIGATSLTKEQLDEIPMQRLATWYPQEDDESPATFHALREAFPPRYLDSKSGFLASLPAEQRSLVTAVLYVRLGKMASHMKTVEKAMWYEIKKRIRLETTPLELYCRTSPTEVEVEARRLRRPTSASQSGSLNRCRSMIPRRSSRHREELQELPAPAEPEPMVEGVDYF